MDTLKIRMKETRSGAPDGILTVTYEAGSVVEFHGAQPVSLGRVFLEQGWAEEMLPEPEPEPVAEEESEVDLVANIPEPEDEPEQEEKQAPPPPETKQIAKPKNKRRSRRR